MTKFISDSGVGSSLCHKPAVDTIWYAESYISTCLIIDSSLGHKHCDYSM